MWLVHEPVGYQALTYMEAVSSWLVGPGLGEPGCGTTGCPGASAGPLVDRPRLWSE